MGTLNPTHSLTQCHSNGLTESNTCKNRSKQKPSNNIHLAAISKTTWESQYQNVSILDFI